MLSKSLLIKPLGYSTSFCCILLLSACSNSPERNSMTINNSHTGVSNGSVANGGSNNSGSGINTPIVQYTATASFDATQGTVSPNTQTVVKNTSAEFTITPKSGYRIDQVTGCNGTLTGNNYRIAKLNANCSVEARFTPAVVPAVTYQVTSSFDSTQGTVSPASQSIEQGKTTAVTVTAKSGYDIASVTGCSGTLTGTTYTTGAVGDNCTISATFKKKLSNVQQAFLKADHRLASAEELINYSQATIVDVEAKRKALIDRLYNNVSGITWFPSHDSVTFNSFAPERSFSVLNSTENHKGDTSNKPLIMAGIFKNHRYSAMGANLFTVNTNDQTDALAKNLLSWLTEKNLTDNNQSLKVVTTHITSRADSWYFPHNEGIRSWLTTHLPNQHSINTANTCDYSALATCIDKQKPDVIIMGDKDRQSLGYAGVRDAIEKAKSQKIPLLFINNGRNASNMGQPIYQYMGITAHNNYWDKHQAKNLTTTQLKQADATLTTVNRFLTNLKNKQFDNNVLQSCSSNYLYCNNTDFDNAFKTGASFYRNSVIGLDKAGIDVFDKSNNPDTVTADSTVSYPLIKAGLLLADKYRSQIDYPINYNDTANWQQAMFADWVVSYVRASNRAQPDLGEYVTDRNNVVLGQNAHYAYPKTVTQTKTISVPLSGQWTTTGWYALPGQTIKVTRTDNSDANVYIKLNYHRANTNRAFEQKVYRGPLELSQARLSVPAGNSMTFSTPYGGPIYLYMQGSDKPLSTTVRMENVANHPTITNFSDEAQITQFNTLINTTELPHVDLRTEGYEQHARRDRFTNAVGGATPTVTALLKSIQNDHINLVYTLAGFKVQGQTLQESLPPAVKSVCENLFGNDCFDEVLHSRSSIQHANFDQNSHCGVGCAGNPWDSSYNISPTGWLDNHELGHNLQVNRLNVQYVSQAEKALWTNYGSRAGENSNNIFPYYAKWHAHFIRDGKTNILYDGHMNHKSIFYAFMSDVANINDSKGNRVVLSDNCRIMDAGTSRYIAPWQSNDYAVHNGYRMGFYIQMALRADKTTFADGTQVDNGFNIYPLLYLHQRIFGKYANNEASWLANREKLGFSLFDYTNATVYGNGRNVSHIPGNDFILVSLSKLTGKDWRPYFDMFGLNYTDLASQQVSVNATKGTVSMGLYELETDMPDAGISKNLNFLPLSLTNHKTLWKGKESPLQCSGF